MDEEPILMSNADPNRLPCGVCFGIIKDHSPEQIAHCTDAMVYRRLCTECRTEIPCVWPNQPIGNYLNALHLHAAGGYGEYIDNLFPCEIVLCKTCADRFCETFPNVKQVLNHHL